MCGRYTALKSVLGRPVLGRLTEEGVQRSDTHRKSKAVADQQTCREE